MFDDVVVTVIVLTEILFVVSADGSMVGLCDFDLYEGGADDIEDVRDARKALGSAVVAVVDDEGPRRKWRSTRNMFRNLISLEQYLDVG